MKKFAAVRVVSSAAFVGALIGAVAAPRVSLADQPTTVPDNTPGWVARAQNLGPTDATQSIDFTVWLKLQNENQLDQQVAAINTPGNANYHKYLSPSQVQAAYSPSNNAVNAVQNYLSAKGFTIVSTAPNNVYVKAEGSVGQIEQAFKVNINNYRYQGHTYRSNASNPSVDGTSGSGQIAAITGLDTSSAYHPDLAQRAAVDGGASPSGNWNQVCNVASDRIKLQSGGTATLNGFTPCGYNAQQLRKAYGIDGLCKLSTSKSGTVSFSGTCGQGQTIVITDAYGSTTLQQDVNKYDQVNGLPALTVGKNLQVVSPPGIANKPESPAQDPIGWQAEVTLDVENAHALAPGANIVLIASPNNYADLDEALNEVVVHHYGNIVSNSWGEIEALLNPGQTNRDERILELGALEGIGFNFSSGDDGDESDNLGSAISADYPTSSPWVTSVGGTSLLLDSNNNYATETGWGTHLQREYDCVAPYASPGTGTMPTSTCTTYTPTPLDEGFYGGSGGGLSRLFQAQPWQQGVVSSSLASQFGTTTSARALPDISMLADPYTGSTIYITDQSVGGTTPVAETYGGTSLACPLFSAVMSLVDQQRAAAGKGPAGLAARYLYNLPSGALHDEGAGTPSAFANGLYYGSSFSGRIFLVGFNQDSSLQTASGWDDVTGVGSPNGSAFVSAVASQP